MQPQRRKERKGREGKIHSVCLLRPLRSLRLCGCNRFPVENALRCASRRNEVLIDTPGVKPIIANVPRSNPFAEGNPISTPSTTQPSTDPHQPLADLEHWEDFVKDHYPHPAEGTAVTANTNNFKPKKDESTFRDYRKE